MSYRLTAVSAIAPMHDCGPAQASQLTPEEAVDINVLPCPCCGGMDVLLVGDDVECGTCGLTMPGGDGMPYAVDGWNQRNWRAA